MAKTDVKIEKVLLNELQLVTLGALKRAADADVVNGDVVAQYKQNVINALLARGVMKQYRGRHYKLTGVPVALKPPHVKRTPKVVTVSDDQVAA